jgi:hypothetical protein
VKFLVDHQLPPALLEAFRVQLPRIVSELETGSQIVELR